MSGWSKQGARNVLHAMNAGKVVRIVAKPDTWEMSFDCRKSYRSKISESTVEHASCGCLLSFSPAYRSTDEEWIFDPKLVRVSMSGIYT